VSVLVILLLVVSIVVNVWLLKRAANPVRQSARSTLLQGIKNVKELTTLRQHFQSVVIFKDSRKLFKFHLPGTERRFILKYGGVITCGSDIENIQISERFAVNSVRMLVPRSKLLDIYADMKSIQVYDQKAGFFTSIKLDDQNQEITKNLEEMRREVMNGDILRRSDENTRAILTSLAASVGMEAEVIFDDGDTEVIKPEPATETDAVPESIPAMEAIEPEAMAAANTEDSH